MKNNTQISILLFFASFFISIFFFSPEIKYNSEINISSVSLLIAKTFAENRFNFHYLLPGFKLNGGFTPYLHWPPIGFYLIAIWIKLFGKSIFLVKIFMLFIKGITDLLFFNYLKNKSIENKWAIISTLIFICLPFRLVYCDLIFPDSFALFFILLIAINQDNQYRFVLLSILGILTSWYIGIFLAGFLFYKIISKQEYKIALSGLLACMLGVGFWLIYILFAKSQIDFSHFRIPNSISSKKSLSFINQLINYSLGGIINQSFQITLAVKWWIKLLGETSIITLSLLIIPFEIKSSLKSAILPLLIGFLLLYLALPVYFMIHNHTMYWISFPLAIIISQKIRFSIHYSIIVILPILALVISKFEHQFKNTKANDEYILSQIQKHKTQNVFIHNPSYQLIKNDFLCTPWLIAYQSNVNLYERMQLKDFYLNKIKTNQDLIISTEKISSEKFREASFNHFYIYSLK